MDKDLAGTVINMTIEEFEAAEEQDKEKMMITMRKSKTASSLGPIRRSENKAVQRLNQEPIIPTVRRAFTPILTFKGNKFRKVNEWIQEIAAQYHLNTAIPNPTIHRKWIDSTAHGECTESAMRHRVCYEPQRSHQ